MKLSELAQAINARLVGDGGIAISGVNTITEARAGEICFYTSAKYARSFKTTQASAVIVSSEMEDCPVAQLVVDNVDRGLIAAMKLFAPKLTPFEGIHPTAVVESDAQVDPGAVIGPNAYISHGVKIGPGTVIGPGCSVGENTVIGAGCRLDSNVVIYHNCRIGNGCIMQANATIGATGYGYSFIKGQHQLIPHNGGVILEDGVEIGANTCVDRAKFGNTVIGAGTKIDNLVQIAHNVKIGKLCLMAGQAGVAGSSKIGDGAVIGGQAGIIDNLTIGEGVMVGARTGIFHDYQPGEKIRGFIGQNINHELRCLHFYQMLPELARQIKELEKKVSKREAADND